MKSLCTYISEAVSNTDYLARELYNLLQRECNLANAIAIENKILKTLPVGSVIAWEDHKAECVDITVWNVDGKKWGRHLVPYKMAAWHVNNANINITTSRAEETGMSDAELRDAAASTTYKATLLKYLRAAKTKDTKEFIQQCIDELSARGELE